MSLDFHHEDHRMMTINGGWINPVKPASGMIDMHAVAISLSNLAAHNGYTARFYSLAQRCTIMSYVIEDMHEGDAREMSRAALLDRCAATWVGLIPPPLHSKVPGMVRMKRGITDMIFEEHGLDPALQDCEEMRELREIVTSTEIRDIKPLYDPEEPWRCLPADEVVINPQMPDAAFANFVLRYNTLFPDRRIRGGYTLSA